MVLPRLLVYGRDLELEILSNILEALANTEKAVVLVVESRMNLWQPRLSRQTVFEGCDRIFCHECKSSERAKFARVGRTRLCLR